ncbi:MAG: hypothetical protein RBS68_06190 [Anaerolineales bacterium]|jgi:hypothetical protein|nr:hypothetical protein [Anaerolineales bacterium]
MTTISVPSERQIINEAAQVLMQHLSPSKATRFWASWQVGEGDYLQIRKELFAKETADSLYEQIEAFQKSKK